MVGLSVVWQQCLAAMRQRSTWTYCLLGLTGACVIQREVWVDKLDLEVEGWDKSVSHRNFWCTSGTECFFLQWCISHNAYSFPTISLGSRLLMVGSAFLQYRMVHRWSQATHKFIINCRSMVVLKAATAHDFGGSSKTAIRSGDQKKWPKLTNLFFIWSIRVN